MWDASQQHIEHARIETSSEVYQQLLMHADALRSRSDVFRGILVEFRGFTDCGRFLNVVNVITGDFLFFRVPYHHAFSRLW